MTEMRGLLEGKGGGGGGGGAGLEEQCSIEEALDVIPEALDDEALGMPLSEEASVEHCSIAEALEVNPER